MTTSITLNPKPIIEYLDQNGIMWEPMDFDIIDGKKMPPKYCINYMPKSTDFAELSSEVIEQRQKIVSAFDYIAIDTREFFQIDVDTHDHELFVERCKVVCPYFESSTKQLPHCFIKANHTVATKRVQTIYKDIEILCGQWIIVELTPLSTTQINILNLRHTGK